MTLSTFDPEDIAPIMRERAKHCPIIRQAIYRAMVGVDWTTTLEILAVALSEERSRLIDLCSEISRRSIVPIILKEPSRAILNDLYEAAE